MRRELLIGCGARRDKTMLAPGESEAWGDLTTLDINSDHKPDVVWDLNIRPLPFDDDTFDSIRAFEVLEHLGRQGDYPSFFAEWSEWWRILKPGGFIMATSPHWSSKWAWMDPGHTRVMGPELLTFLVQTEYDRQIGKTPMSDYRYLYKADFDIIHSHVDDGSNFQYGLKAVKPSRCSNG
jgi:SAM-dependent methyltransferase